MVAIASWVVMRGHGRVALVLSTRVRTTPGRTVEWRGLHAWIFPRESARTSRAPLSNVRAVLHALSACTRARACGRGCACARARSSTAGVTGGRRVRNVALHLCSRGTAQSPREGVRGGCAQHDHRLAQGQAAREERPSPGASAPHCCKAGPCCGRHFRGNNRGVVASVSGDQRRARAAPELQGDGAGRNFCGRDFCGSRP